MAEWSKALVLGTSHFDGVGSNPTAATSFIPTYFSSLLSCLYPILFNFILHLQISFGEFHCTRVITDPSKLIRTEANTVT